MKRIQSKSERVPGKTWDVRILVYMALCQEPHANPAGFDRGLYDALTRGIHREYRFLELLILWHCKKNPKDSLKRIISIGLYQGLFLDHIPEYANFNSIKNLMTHFGFSGAEQKFVHAVMKKILHDRNKWMQWREDILNLCAQGDGSRLKNYTPKEICAVLNLTSDLLSEFERIGEKIGLTAVHIWKSMAAFKRQAPLLARLKYDDSIPSGAKVLQGALVDSVMLYSDADQFRMDLSLGRIFAQGECSQWLCEKVAAYLLALAPTTIKVLEIAAGKGGKTMGTLQALKKGGMDLKNVQWTALDVSAKQEEAFRAFAEPYINQLGARIHYGTLETTQDGPNNKNLFPESFDLIWIDAPCSGLGTMSKYPEVALRANSKVFLELQSLQWSMIQKWIPYLRPKGVLVYSVCTLSGAETEGICHMVAKHMPGLKTVWKHHLWPGLNEDKTACEKVLTPASPEGFFSVMWEKLPVHDLKMTRESMPPARVLSFPTDS